MILHAGLIARFEPSGWRGVLIQGASGSGKSDLAIRAIEAGWSLVADDRVLVWKSGGKVYGRAVNPLSGLIEIRGLGVLPLAARALVAIELIAICSPQASIERFPSENSETLLGYDIPRVNLDAFEPSAVAKLCLALSHLAFGHKRRIKPSAPAFNPPGAGGVP